MAISNDARGTRLMDTHVDDKPFHCSLEMHLSENESVALEKQLENALLNAFVAIGQCNLVCAL